ncbi:LacI family DNA-binding transcriptional regulator [Streptococcus sp. DD13]|uniref:LacI family DNA-binding transcriptional regulator n=1 Tax=Streptococcus sp. DD13 TaxID=1777881 RepID=UPI00079542CA|nr:LacI family DNA-binding transcriptional regulator [Streptococcus sp. DD13]KXT78112.1 Sucrose operon repressor ScrR, LacI family [Streptococcus sp. DD13]
MVAKLTDVAALAGVSPTTVSRVINKKGYLSKKTIQKVEAAMKELSYKPNNLARSLQGKSAKLVGLIFPTVNHIFFAELISYLEEELFNRGYKIILCNSQHDSEKEKEYLEMLEANQVDGIISGSHNLGIEDYNQVNAPIISFDRNLAPDITVVSSDNYLGGQLAGQRLKDLGCQQTLVLTGSDNSNSPTGLRQVGFRESFPDAPVIKIAGDLAIQDKQEIIRQILQEEQPDGIFTTDDLTAITVEQVARELGIHIPDQLKLIGYDATSFIQHYHPHLTTLKQPIKEIAQLLVELLMKKLHEEPLEQTCYTLPVNLLNGTTA